MYVLHLSGLFQATCALLSDVVRPACVNCLGASAGIILGLVIYLQRRKDRHASRYGLTLEAQVVFSLRIGCQIGQPLMRKGFDCDMTIVNVAQR